MGVVQRAAFLQRESRTRPRLSDEAVATMYVTGGALRNAPAQVQGLAAAASIGRVRFTWSAVTETEAGKPLEALARYQVFYKYDIAPNIPLIIPSEADGYVFVDNTSLSLPIKRVQSGNDWVTQYVAVRVRARDRWGRYGQLSDQVESTTLFARVAQVLDWGTVTSYDPNSEGGVQYTIVRSWSELIVPNGYMYVITVFPLGMLDETPPVQDPDFGPWISNFVYGLWWADEIVNESWPYLMPGTYHNVRVPVMHSIFKACYATCFDPGGSPTTQQPLYIFDPTVKGNMRIAGFIKEQELPPPSPKYFEDEVFQKVYWMIWKIPL